ncbi:MAG: metal-dependent phosphohydrolase [Pseudomonadota bacterium]
MFNPSSSVAAAFADHLSETYLEYFSRRVSEHAAYIHGCARLILERLGNSDAPYHNAEHTMMVTLVGQEILRGRLLTEAVEPDDWLHYMLALLVHDIGYARGICRGDTKTSVIIDSHGNSVTPPRGASDAYLAPWHIERGILYVRQRFSDSAIVDEERLVRSIEYTRFPVPTDAAFQDNASEPGLVRAADLIGQMADPFYHRKIKGLFHEFQEIGAAEALGYQNAYDLVERYPEFFWSQVKPLIGPALEHLEQTTDGKQWIAQLYNHVFRVEHQSTNLGPFRGNELPLTTRSAAE